jgi:hypothetical protein
MANSNYKAILYNRYVLYFVLLISLCDLYFLAITGNSIYVVIFFLVGFLTQFFSKNMMVVLLVALVVTNVLKHGKSAGLVDKFEGFESKKGKKDKDEYENEDTKENEERDDEGFELFPQTEPTVGLEVQKKIKGIDAIENNTTSLLETQKQLMENMKSLEPMLDSANEILSKFEKFQN